MRAYLVNTSKEMATNGNIEVIDDNKYLLVSDSNEVGEQYDSKKLSQRELAEMAQDNLFKKFLDMSGYLTINKFNVYKSILEEKIKIQQDLFDKVKSSKHRKLKVEDGQVILVDCQEFDKYKNANSNISLMEYLKKYWEIPSDCIVNQISNCMLRGVTDKDQADSSPIKRSGNTVVGITENNMPTHMHHSSVTTGSNIECLQVGSTHNATVKDQIMYDLFYNDSFSTGVQFNELDGTVDGFTVQPSGDNVAASGQQPKITHNNMPVYRKFYAFEIRKV